jgi:hypothetical protein
VIADAVGRLKRAVWLTVQGAAPFVLFAAEAPLRALASWPHSGLFAVGLAMGVAAVLYEAPDWVPEWAEWLWVVLPVLAGAVVFTDAVRPTEVLAWFAGAFPVLTVAQHTDYVE